jgi:(2Fe-2S) ferredoxin
MPQGVSYRGMTTAPAHAIVEQHRLDAWVMEDEYYEEDEDFNV